MANARMFHLLLMLFLSLGSFVAFAAEESRPAGTNPTFMLNGSAELLSHYVEHGLSQTHNAPALQGSFWFNFGSQFRLGLWGSNVDYKDGSEHLVLKPTADLKINFSTNTELVLKYSQNMYYSTTHRNGNTLGLHLVSFGYRVNYEKESNWEGTNTSATYYSLGKTFDIRRDFKWSNDLGYTMVTQDTLSNFFDVRSFVGYKLGQLFYQGGVTLTSNPGQFADGIGDFFIIISATYEF